MTADGLGNHATTTETGDESRRNERTLDQETIRRGVRRALTGNKNHETLIDCGNPLPGEQATTWERDSNGRVSLGNIVRCGSKQLCVHCAGRLRAVDAMLIAWRVLSYFLTGGGVSMMTVAPRHQRGEALAPNKACLLESFNAAWRSTAMRAIREKFGIVGEAKVFEVTHGDNGWHPHLHVLLFHGAFLDITEGEERELVVTFWRVFNKQLAKWATKTCQHPKAARSGVSYTPVIENGRPTGRRTATYKPPSNAEWYCLDPKQVRDADLAHGINFVPITPDGEAGNKIAAYVGKIQLEMTRSDLKTGKTEGSRSVFQIMNDYGHGNDPADGALIREVADVLKGVQLVVWSGAFHGDDPLYGEPTDEFAAEMTAAYYESQGLEPPDGERETIGGTAADVHRAADRANTPDGHPLLWQARVVLEQTGQLDDVAALFNEVLAPVYVDRDTELPYPIIRFAEPPPVTIERPEAPVDELAVLREGIRRLGDEKRRQLSERWIAGANDTPVSPGRRRQAPPGGWLNHYRNMTNSDIEAHAALAKKGLQREGAMLTSTGTTRYIGINGDRRRRHVDEGR